jgi:hypothetical protein
VLTLAIGIAASTTVFSWIDTVLVRPIPGVSNGHELLSFESLMPNGEFMTSSYPDYRDYRDHLKLLAGLAVIRPDPLSIGEEDRHDAMPFTEYISASLMVQKIAASLLGVLGVVALLLAAVGLYSVVAYSITQLTHEIGIRVALGAKSSDVVGLVVRQGMGLTVVGLVVGVVAAAAVTRLVSGLLVKVSATDPLIFAGAALFLAMVALAASCAPALRATRIDPNAALRCQ